MDIRNNFVKCVYDKTELPQDMGGKYIYLYIKDKKYNRL